MKTPYWVILRIAIASLTILGFFTILWGVWVKVTLSGDGCGPHWPFCWGKALWTSFELVAASREWLHRFLSGLWGLGIIILWATTLASQNELIKKIRSEAHFILILAVIEALIGAILVKKQWVASHFSWGRIWVGWWHLANSWLLLTALWWTWLKVNHLGFTRTSFAQELLSKKRLKTIGFWIPVAFTGVIGSLTRLAFEKTSGLEALLMDFWSSNLALKLRVLHPIFALVGLITATFVIRNLMGRIFLFLLGVSGALSLWHPESLWIKIFHVFSFYITSAWLIHRWYHQTHSTHYSSH